MTLRGGIFLYFSNFTQRALTQVVGFSFKCQQIFRVRMWPIITAMARSYAPQIVLPAAMVAGTIGEKVYIGKMKEKGKV